MGEARRRGSLEECKAEAIKAGRSLEINRRCNREIKRIKANMKQAYLAYLMRLMEETLNQREIAVNLGTLK